MKKQQNQHHNTSPNIPAKPGCTIRSLFGVTWSSRSLYGGFISLICFEAFYSLNTKIHKRARKHQFTDTQCSHLLHSAAKTYDSHLLIRSRSTNTASIQRCLPHGVYRILKAIGVFPFSLCPFILSFVGQRMTWVMYGGG